MTVIVLENASVLDPDRGTLLPDHSVVVCDDRITEVAPGPEVRVSEPDRAIDVRGRVVMPGLIDAHVHVYLQSLDLRRLASWLPSYLVPKAAVALRDMLRRGFTTVRDTGGADFALAQAIADGLIEGPRLIFGGPALSQTGGHGDARDPGQQTVEGCPRCPAVARIADGPDELRKAARDILRTGAHHLKMMLTGGVISPLDDITSVQFGPDEIAVVVREAAATGRYVLGHAYQAAAINSALRQGVRSIEHGNFLDEESVSLFVANDAFLVPTLVTYQMMDRVGRQLGMSDAAYRKNAEVLAAGLSSLELAHRGGVDIAYGSDLVGELQDRQLDEFLIRAQVQPPRELIRSATTVAARLLGMGDEVGLVRPGYLADLLVLDGNPLEDIAVLARPDKNLRAVMRAGRILVDRSLE